MVNNAMTLAEAIRIARARENMSQKQLADKCGLSQTRISQLERGIYPRPGEVDAIASAIELGLSEGAA